MLWERAGEDREDRLTLQLAAPTSHACADDCHEHLRRESLHHLAARLAKVAGVCLGYEEQR